MWSQDDAAQAAEIWQDHFTDIHGEDYETPALVKARHRVLQRIADETGRSFISVEIRLRACGPSFGANQRSRNSISAQQLAQRAARAEAENYSSLTALIMGDPPPGYSALDRRRGGAQQ